MRLSEQELKDLTNRSMPSAQARWFKRYFGVDVEFDRRGVIITKQAVEALVARKCGISALKPPKPPVKLMKERDSDD